MTNERRDPPPYVPWRTFLTATGQLEGALPPKLDPSVFPTHAGSTKSQLLAAFKFLGFTEADGAVTETLRTWVNDLDQRPNTMKTILSEKYPRLLKLADENATPKQMQDVFSEMNVKGSTLRKAMTFFVKACEFAEVKVPPNWARMPAAPPRTDGQRRARRQPREQGVSQPSTPQSQGNADIDTKTLVSGGTVTLSVETNMVRLTPEDRDWLFKLIDHFRSYPSSGEGSEADAD